MIKSIDFARRTLFSASILALLASCSTTDYTSVQAVVPADKPTSEQMLSSLQATDTPPGDGKPVEVASLGTASLRVGNALAGPQTLPKSSEPFVTATKNTNLNGLIAKYSAIYGVPERLVHRVVRRESNYNPSAVSRGNWGLMQIRYNTARGMGYDGSVKGLLDAETNLKYAVKYLRGAWIVAGKNEDKADWLYRTGYYYHAKRQGLLVESGLKQPKI